MENKIKHLELIQGIINRMSGNSFMLKGWAVTLVAGIFSISSKDTGKLCFLVVYIPVIVFWFLDAFYLYQEHLYICLYNEVRLKKEADIDFSLNTAHCKSNDFTDYVNCLISKTESAFYVSLAVICTGIIVVTHI